MLLKLKKKNEELILQYANNQRKLEKQLLIKKLLSEKNCFLQMNIETAYSILRDLELPEKSFKKIYLQLISFN